MFGVDHFNGLSNHHTDLWNGQARKYSSNGKLSNGGPWLMGICMPSRHGATSSQTLSGKGKCQHLVRGDLDTSLYR